RHCCQALLRDADSALFCNCTTPQCVKDGYKCKTNGACVVSTSIIDGQEQLLRFCIQKVELVPLHKPFYCLSIKGLMNTHCCYSDYCNSIDLSLPTVTSGPGSGQDWGPLELTAVVVVPVFVLCVLVLLGVFLFLHHQRAYGHRQRLEVEDPSTEHMFLTKDKTLQDLIYDLSTSGSGSVDSAAGSRRLQCRACSGMAAGRCECICVHSEPRTFGGWLGVKKGSKEATFLQEKHQGQIDILQKVQELDC
ncbi:activin receptor type-1B-like, partial [Onychostoma macrolepis]|uniref:activin receptor type-1B-like n=1 Tax=Onychostoma macrolepis TaxID=369639 RepID=UPI00272C3895